MIVAIFVVLAVRSRFWHRGVCHHTITANTRRSVRVSWLLWKVLGLMDIDIVLVLRLRAQPRRST